MVKKKSQELKFKNENRIAQTSLNEGYSYRALSNGQHSNSMMFPPCSSFKIQSTSTHHEAVKSTTKSFPVEPATRALNSSRDTTNLTMIVLSLDDAVFYIVRGRRRSLGFAVVSLGSDLFLVL